LEQTSYSEIVWAKLIVLVLISSVPRNSSLKFCVYHSKTVFQTKVALFEAVHLQASVSVQVTVPGFIFFLQDSGLS
jgi:hypothetical protein